MTKNLFMQQKIALTTKKTHVENALWVLYHINGHFHDFFSKPEVTATLIDDETTFFCGLVNFDGDIRFLRNIWNQKVLDK